MYFVISSTKMYGCDVFFMHNKCSLKVQSGFLPEPVLTQVSAGMTMSGSYIQKWEWWLDVEVVEIFEFFAGAADDVAFADIFV
jgi:hypothetical protein